MSDPKPESKEEREQKLAEKTPTPVFLVKMAERLGEDPLALKQTILRTCMYNNASIDEFRTFMVVAANLGLNPLAGEIYAFRKKQGGIQVIVGKEGFNTLNNTNPDYDGRRFYYYYQIGNEVKRFEMPMDHYDLVMVECQIFRKTHKQPEIAFAKWSEYNRPELDTWQNYPTTMLEHKAFIKASKGAFGYAGLVDMDEAARFCELRSAPPVAEQEVREYTVPSEPESEKSPVKPVPPSPANALATAKQKKQLLDLAKKAGMTDPLQLTEYLKSRGMPQDAITFSQMSDLIAQLEGGDYSDIQKYFDSLKK